MIVAFCGHKDFYSSNKYRELDRIIRETCEKYPDAEFFCGGYGFFDSACYESLGKLKSEFPDIKRIFISPYLKEEHFKTAKQYYDDVIYPPIENTPLRYAIIKRNEWMVDNADLIIAYVNHDWGGAFRTLDYARRKKKPFINIGSFVFNK